MIKRNVVFIMMLFLVAGCARLGINLNTREKQVLAARVELNLLLEQYIQIQGQIDDKDHSKAKIAFRAADTAIDTMEAMLLNTGYKPGNDMQKWLDAKNVVMAIIVKYGGK